MKLSIVIPAHNEARRLPPVLEKYARYFESRMGNDVEILVVANFCSDQTAREAAAVARHHSNIRILDDPRRIGKGGAIIMGAQAAVGEWIGFADADGATAPEEFERIYAIAQTADGAIGSRWMQGADVSIPQKRMRLLSSRVFNLFIRLLLGLPYMDTQCGAKVFRAAAWRRILPDIGITRFAFDVDLLFQLKRNGFRVVETPTVWHDVAGSTVHVFQSSIDMFLAVVRMRLLHSPLRFLMPVYERFLGQPVEFLRTDPLFRHTVLLSGAAMIAHVCNILFQMIVGRELPANEYALLATFLALFSIMQRPFSTIATAMNYYASLLIKNGKHALLGRLVIKWSLIAAVPSFFLSLICVFFSLQISAYFHLERVEPIVVAALALPALCVSPVLFGANAGMQRFGISALASSIGAIARVALTGLLVYLVFAAAGWALVGHVGGLYASVFVVFITLSSYLLKYRGGTQEKLPSLRVYLFWTFLINLAAGFLATGDIVLMRRFLPEDSGFAYAATLSRITIILSSSVVSAMFPKVASVGTFRRQDRAVYLRSVVYTLMFLGVGLVLNLAVPGLLLRVFFGLVDVDKSVLTQTRWMALAMSVVALFNINLMLLLAQRRFRLLSIVFPCSFGYLYAATTHNPSSAIIIVSAGIFNGIALVVTTIGILRTPCSENIVDEGNRVEL